MPVHALPEAAAALRVLGRALHQLDVVVALGRLAVLALGLARGLGILLGLLLSALLGARLLGELGLGAGQAAARVHDGEDQEANHNGEGVQRVAVLLMEGDRVRRRDAAGELGDAVYDAELIPWVLALCAPGSHKHMGWSEPTEMKPRTA